MRRLLIFSVFLVFQLLNTCNAAATDDSIHYFFTFTNDASKISINDQDQPLEDAEDIVRITTHNNEKFRCKLPNVVAEAKQLTDYNGPTPAELLESLLYKDKMCSVLIDVYWTYNVCHGRFITQFHHEKNMIGGVTHTEYNLGNYNIDYTTKKSLLETLNPPTRHIENEDYPYYLVSYNRGTSCDVTGKPRTTDVIYICVENVQQKVLSITEVSSCHYEVIIMSDFLCKHPSYRLSEKKDHGIICLNEDAEDEETAKPHALQRLDDFHGTTFKREYTITNQELVEDDNVVDVEEFDKIQNKRGAIGSKGVYKLAGGKRFENKETLANNPAVVDHTVNSILTGNECIVGGQGWWKYEFCYGKHVSQFHEEQNGQRSDVLLGTFDEAIHEAWVKESPLLRGPTKIGNHITQVSHIFTKGDICDETGAHRSVEVKLRCQHSEYSALAIALSLTEPRTCEYVLVIDSERFCEPLQYADDLGIIRLEDGDEAQPVKESSEPVPHTEL